MANIDDENLIEITDDEGNIIECKLYDIIEFEGKQYALLYEAEFENDEEEPELVLMRYIEEGEDVLFEVIDDDDEFDKVQEYIENLDEDDADEE